jgi:hypothetical protein
VQKRFLGSDTCLGFGEVNIGSVEGGGPARSLLMYIPCFVSWGWHVGYFVTKNAP